MLKRTKLEHLKRNSMGLNVEYIFAKRATEELLDKFRDLPDDKRDKEIGPLLDGIKELIKNFKNK